MTHTILRLVPAAVALVLVGGIAPAETLLPKFDPDRFVEGQAIDNKYFPLEPGRRAVLFAAVVAVAWLTGGLRDLREEQAALREDWTRAVAMGEGWRADNSAPLDHLAVAIESQFDAWSLTPAEADIAGLLL